KGISIDTTWYQAPEFGNHMGECVYVFYDVADMGNVYVYREGDNGKEFLCIAVNVEWQWIDKAEFATRSRKRQKKLMQEASKEFKKIAKRAALEDIHQEVADRKVLAKQNIIKMPQPQEEYTTPALGEAARAAEAIINRGRPQPPATISAEDDAKAMEILAAAEDKEEKSPVVCLTEHREEKIAEKWEALDGWERYEMLTKLSKLSESQLKWIEFYKTTREFEYLQDIYEEGGEERI
ncbi:MAG: Mu transposase C-terminal domain-containing protein, partial [Desulfobacteraceae bacterium]|nr:Mu transposase C-terminal domain-containing protein [Desulfobacteraceae bacterium]